MISIISTVAYALASIPTVLLTARATNARMRKTPAEELSPAPVPYSLSAKTVLLWIALAAISALCGFVISQKATYPLALPVLGICYLAALSAAVMDLKIRIIPNYIPLSVIGIRSVIFIYEFIVTDTALEYLLSSLIGCLLCFVLLGVANKISKGGIGGGDIKLLSAIGFCSGVYLVFSALILALICCSLVSVVLLITKKKEMKGSLPFGPFIYVGITLGCLLTLY